MQYQLHSGQKYIFTFRIQKYTEIYKIYRKYRCVVYMLNVQSGVQTMDVKTISDGLGKVTFLGPQWK